MRLRVQYIKQQLVRASRARAETNQIARGDEDSTSTHRRSDISTFIGRGVGGAMPPSLVGVSSPFSVSSSSSASVARNRVPSLVLSTMCRYFASFRSCWFRRLSQIASEASFAPFHHCPFTGADVSLQTRGLPPTLRCSGYRPGRTSGFAHPRSLRHSAFSIAYRVHRPRFPR